MMVGIWDCLFLGAMLNFRGVTPEKDGWTTGRLFSFRKVSFQGNLVNFEMQWNFVRTIESQLWLAGVKSGTTDVPHLGPLSTSSFPSVMLLASKTHIGLLYIHIIALHM